MYMYVNKRVELAQWGNSAVENLCIIIIIIIMKKERKQCVCGGGGGGELDVCEWMPHANSLEK